MSSFKSFFRLFTLVAFSLSLSHVGLAARDERGRRPEDFQFQPRQRTNTPQEATEFTAKEEDKINELVVLFGYSYEQAKRKVKRARQIRRTLLALGVFVTVSIVAGEVLSDTPYPSVSNINSLVPVLLDQPTTTQTFQFANGDTLFEVRRNMPQRAFSCKKLLTQGFVQHTILSPN